MKLLLLLTGVYLYNFMTELYFGHEIAIGFKNVMLRIKIIANIVFTCRVTIHEFKTNTFLKWGDLEHFTVVVMHICHPIIPSHPIIRHTYLTGYIYGVNMKFGWGMCLCY